MQADQSSTPPLLPDTSKVSGEGRVSLVVRALRNFVWLLLAVGCGWAVLDRIRPPREIETYTQKLQEFASRKDDFDVLFLGSSRVYHQIQPALFDQFAAAAGRPVRTFNFGVDGMFPPEDGYVAEQIFALHPGRLRWVFLEVSNNFSEVMREAPESARSVYWHDWKRTTRVLRALWPAVRERPSKARSLRGRLRAWNKRMDARWRALDRVAGDLQMHFRAWALCLTHARVGSELLAARLDPPDALEKENYRRALLGTRLDGFTPSYPPDGKLEGSKLAEYVAACELERLRPPTETPLRIPLQESLDEVISLIRSRGAQPILLISPFPAKTIDVPRDTHGAPLLNFTDFSTWPELFLPEHRHDFGHLNRTGSELYTRDVVQRWLEETRP